jgi:hypothetical protein
LGEALDSRGLEGLEIEDKNNRLIFDDWLLDPLINHHPCIYEVAGLFFAILLLENLLIIYYMRLIYLLVEYVSPP